MQFLYIFICSYASMKFCQHYLINNKGQNIISFGWCITNACLGDWKTLVLFPEWTYLQNFLCLSARKHRMRKKYYAFLVQMIRWMLKQHIFVKPVRILNHYVNRAQNSILVKSWPEITTFVQIWQISSHYNQRMGIWPNLLLNGDYKKHLNITLNSEVRLIFLNVKVLLINNLFEKQNTINKKSTK